MSLRGENYAIEIQGHRATARVWKRPDLDAAAGAAGAASLVAALTDVAATIDALVFDVREAPVIAGPRTVETLTTLLRAYESRGKRIAVVAATEPLQTLQYRRLVSTYAPSCGRLTFSTAEAEAWTVARRP